MPRRGRLQLSKTSCGCVPGEQTRATGISSSPRLTWRAFRGADGRVAWFRGQPALAKLRQSITDEAHHAHNQQLALQDRIDALQDNLSAVQDTVVAVEAELARSEAAFNADKERHVKESLAEGAEIESLEQQLVELRQDAGAVIVQRQGKLQKVRMDFEATAQALSAEKERCSRDMIAMLEMLVEHKHYIEKSLEELHAAVATGAQS